MSQALCLALALALALAMPACRADDRSQTSPPPTVSSQLEGPLPSSELEQASADGLDCDEADALDAQAERAKGLMLSDPSAARDAYRALVECDPRPPWRLKLGLAHERAEEPCAALSIYRRVVDDLVDRERENVERRVIELAPYCEI